ncbi:MAG: cytochrome c [Rhodanobacteraceae bacterium]
MRFIGALILWAVIFIIAAAAFIYSGTYNIGADSPHWPVTKQLIGALRDHSIAQRDGNVTVPNLDDPALITEGAGHYAEMCVGCHMAPGMSDSELRTGLYPKPPNLAKSGIDNPAEAFWFIKHGIKMSGMPAWGLTHDDQKIWSMVAFVRKLPSLSAEQFKQMAASAGNEEMPGAEMGDHGHAAPAPASTLTNPATPSSSGAISH